MGQGAPSRKGVERLRFVSRGERSTEPRKQGSFMRDGQASRIDGLNIKPLWLLQKIPPAPGVVLQRTARELDFRTVVTGLHRIPGRMQAGKHPLPHLRSSGEREGDGQNLFRLVHFRKQLQQPSSQQLGLARTRGGPGEEAL